MRISVLSAVFVYLGNAGELVKSHSISFCCADAGIEANECVKVYLGMELLSASFCKLQFLATITPLLYVL